MPISFTDLITQIDTVLTPVLGYIECGCTVAGISGEFTKLAEEYKAKADECTNFAGDSAQAFLDAAGNGFENLHEALVQHSPFKPGEQQLQECYGPSTLPPDIWFPISKTGGIQVKSENPPFMCQPYFCPSGYLVVKEEDREKCSAHCPEPIKSVQLGEQCYKEQDWIEVQERCKLKSPPLFKCCAPGQKAVAENGNSVNCKRACSAPLHYFDPEIGCTSCSFNSVPVYYSDPSMNSAGYCKECPPGLSGEGNTECLPCSPGQVMWYIGAPPKVQSGLKKQNGPFTVMAPSPPTQPPGTVMPAPPPAWPAKKRVPTLWIEGGRCTVCPENWTPVYDSDPTKSSFGHCEECPPGAYTANFVEMLPSGPHGELSPAPNFWRCRTCPAGVNPTHPHVCLAVKAAPVEPPVVPGNPGD